MRNSTPARSATRDSYVERINRAIDHILGHLDQPLRLNLLARQALLSPFHFHRVFQALIGQTPAEFVKRLRLEKALGLMSRPKPASLTAIALRCGFASASDFSRNFKQQYGVAPRAFDLAAWRAARGAELEQVVGADNGRHLLRLPPRTNPDGFQVRIRRLPPRTVAYIRVDRPYQGQGVIRAAERLVAWAERNGHANGEWLGYQWDNPEITPLEDCRYHVAVTAANFTPQGLIGRFEFPAMTVAEIEMSGGIDLELRALYWLYGVWLPRSGYVPDDPPGFEVWRGRPFANGFEHFELKLQLPVRRG